MKVVKFGGSSLANAEQFKKVASIVLADKTRRYVIPSAPGRRFNGDIKVTDLLYRMASEAQQGEDFSETLAQIKDRYNEIIEGLELKDFSLDEQFAGIEARMKKDPDPDFAASRGEHLNGRIMAAYLGFEFVDPFEMVFFDEEGILDDRKTMRAVEKRLSEVEYAVIPGFYGCSHEGKVKTFSRGGSDVTGSIVAGACHADVYENWTDVSGFLVADPRIIKNPARIETITYRELRELSYMGASVLHEEAIFPVRRQGIPINIRNTNRPQDAGTMIVSNDFDFSKESLKHTITGIAGKKGFSTINIEKAMMNNETGFGMKVLKVLFDNGLSFEHMPSGIDTMSITLSTDKFAPVRDKVISELRKAVEPDHIDVEDGIAMLAVVGRRMKNTRGTVARIFAALAHARINVKLIDQGSSELNVIVGVSENDLPEAIRRIYDMFINSEKQ